MPVSSVYCSGSSGNAHTCIGWDCCK